MGETIEQVKARYDNINLAALPQISQQAIKKLKDEKCDANTEILRYLVVLAIADGDEMLAKKVVFSTNKTLLTCWKHVSNWVSKKPRTGNSIAINHEDIASEAIHYYLDVQEKTASTPLPVKPVEEEDEDIEIPEDDNQGSLFDEKSYEQGSLFGDDF